MAIDVRLARLVVAVIALFPLAATLSSSQEQSVRPGINDRFKKPDVKEFIKKFETESREIYAQRQAILDACQIKPGMAVADIGAGTGLFTMLFARTVGPKGKVYAVDIAPEFLKHIEQTARQEKVTNVVAVLCTQKSTELPPNSVDLVFICDTYHHFEFPFRTMESIHRALKPGGQVVLIDFKRIKGVSSEWIMNHVRAGQEVFTREVQSCGFRQVEERDFLKENYFVRFVKNDLPKSPP